MNNQARRSKRFEITLTNGQNFRSVTLLGFTPNKIVMLNNTSNPLYVRRGSPDIPTVTNKDYIVSPASATAPGNVTLPTSVREFGFFIPTTPAWTDLTAVCTIIIEGDGTLPNDFFEVRLDAGNQNRSIEVPFNPNHVFIYNTSDAPLYLVTGNINPPDQVGADLIIFPTSYYIFTPYEGYLYGAFLDSPTQYDCIIFFVLGDAEFARKIWDFPNFTLPGLMIPLEPLPNPNVVANFNWAIVP